MHLPSYLNNWFHSIGERWLERTTYLDLLSITDIPVFKLSSDEVNIDKESKSIELPKGNVEIEGEQSRYVVCEFGDTIYGVDDTSETAFILTPIKPTGKKEPVLSVYDTIDVDSSTVENYKGKQKSKVLLGRCIANYMFFINPFGDIVDFINETISPKQLERIVSKLYLNKIVDLTDKDKDDYSAHDRFMRNFFFLSGFSDLIVPVLSEKALQTDPKVLKRKEELLEKHKDELDDPIVATKIEEELVAMDKEWLKGDPSEGFFYSDTRKIALHRKKQFIMNGIVEDFGEEREGFKFVTSSMTDGLQMEDIPVTNNEIIKGSHDRGINTAKGGEISKILLQVFQSVVIQEQDCGTKKYLEFELTESLAGTVMHRHIAVGGKLVELTEDNIKQYIGRNVKMRSMLYCKSLPGYCFKCADKGFEQLEQHAIGIDALDIGSTFVSQSMASMHGKVTQVYNMENLDDFIVDVEPL